MILQHPQVQQQQNPILIHTDQDTNVCFVSYTLNFVTYVRYNYSNIILKAQELL